MKLPGFWWLPVGKVPEIEPQRLFEWLNNGKEVQIVDARTGLEYQSDTVAGAIHAPLVEMPASMKRLSLDPQRPVVVLCLSGHRSRPGTRWLRAGGFEAYSLRGGLLAWKAAKYPTEPPSQDS